MRRTFSARFVRAPPRPSGLAAKVKKSRHHVLICVRFRWCCCSRAVAHAGLSSTRRREHLLRLPPFSRGFILALSGKQGKKMSCPTGCRVRTKELERIKKKDRRNKRDRTYVRRRSVREKAELNGGSPLPSEEVLRENEGSGERETTDRGLGGNEGV